MNVTHEESLDVMHQLSILWEMIWSKRFAGTNDRVTMASSIKTISRAIESDKLSNHQFNSYFNAVGQLRMTRIAPDMLEMIRRGISEESIGKIFKNVLSHRRSELGTQFNIKAYCDEFILNFGNHHEVQKLMLLI